MKHLNFSRENTDAPPESGIQRKRTTESRYRLYELGRLDLGASVCHDRVQMVTDFVALGTAGVQEDTYMQLVYKVEALPQ